MTRAPAALIVGYGWVGAILASELTRNGYDVVVLERGAALEENRTGYYYRDGGERLRLQQVQNTAVQTYTLRHSPLRPALPLRRLGSFLNGEGTGGAGVLWGGTSTRFTPGAFRPATLFGERAKARSSDAIDYEDWPIGYDELEPDFVQFERAIGVSGLDGENPSSGPRSIPFPVRSSVSDEATALFGRAAETVGLNPFTVPSADLYDAYTNPLGVTRIPDERTGTTLATPLNTLHPATAQTGQLRLITGARVRAVLHDSKRATGVRYTDGDGEHTIEADVVLLAAWTLENTRLLLVSGIGKPYDPATRTGVVGRGFCGHVNIPTTGFFERRFDDAARGRTAVAFADFDPGWTGDDAPIGAALHTTHTDRQRDPFESAIVPEGTPGWGAEWKVALKQYHGRKIRSVAILELVPSFDRYLDLDPVYRDANGDPLLRITFNYNQNDRELMTRHATIAQGVLRAAGAQSVESDLYEGDYNAVPYQNTHWSGGVRFGSDPSKAALNSNLRSFDLANLWVVGASALPSSSAPPPTLTVGALAYRASRDILSYLGSRRGDA
jgi:gluconate 2-dehydrogenase alpha chain